MKEIIKLPFGESLKRTYLYLLGHLNRGLRLILIGTAIMVAADIALSFPSQCREGENCLGWKNNLAMLAAALTAVSVSVAFTRQIILKSVSSGFPVSFGLREVKYFLYNLLVLMMIIFAILVCGIIYSLFWGDARALQKPATLLPFLLIVLTLTVFLSRLCLILPAVAVDNNKLTVAQVWEMTRGNSAKIFFGMFLVSLPVVIAILFVNAVLQTLTVESWIAKLFASALVSSLTIFNALIKACYLAHIYQYFTYFYKPEKEDDRQVKSLLD